MTSQPRVLVIGDLIEDVVVAPSGPIRIDTDTPAEIYRRPGGSAANFACWLAHATGSLGVSCEVNFVGRVGAADLERHRQIFQAAGVTPRLQADAVAETGSIVVLVEAQARSFLTSRGANRNLDAAAIEDELFSASQFVYLSGYSLFDSLSVAEVQSIIQRAKRAGAKVVCDPGSAGFIEDFGVVKFLAAIDGVDLLLPSLEEARVLSGENDARLAAEWLAQRFETVIVTSGSEGAQLCEAGSQPQTVAAVAADVVDATGAGDAFAAGYIAGLLLGLAPLDAAAQAARLGAIAVTLPGGRPAN